MLPTTPAKATHDYQRNGTIDLFAALNIATGTVLTELRPNHTSEQFIKFLNKINRDVPDDLDVHVILDNLSTHKTPGRAQMAAPSSPVPLPFHADLRNQPTRIRQRTKLTGH